MRVRPPRSPPESLDLPLGDLRETAGSSARSEERHRSTGAWAGLSASALTVSGCSQEEMRSRLSCTHS